MHIIIIVDNIGKDHHFNLITLTENQKQNPKNRKLTKEIMLHLSRLNSRINYKNYKSKGKHKTKF